MKYLKELLCSAVLLSAAPALAGEDVVYAPAPEWIASAAMPAARPGPPVVLYDDQRRIENGRLWTYVDRAIRIDNPQMLTALGTFQASWMPDKGDLIVHRVSILRGGEEIDVLGQGARLDVLRREAQLEQRIVDGARTATLVVPGLRVGDVLRITYSTTLADQALGKEVQDAVPLPAAPFTAGYGRVRVSWPKDEDIHVQATRGVTLPQPVVENGFDTIELKVPLAEQPEMPNDAPVRYRLPPMLQASSFSDWREVSRVMAPLFATEGTIAPGSPIAREVTRIQGENRGQLERAVAALRLVQDEVAYLLNGMEGGNYIPQTPAETWEKRYGDCKAKTLLLLAMLRAMGIEAEATVVSSRLGDAVPTMLPQPGAFDHVIVHAVIGGKDYWLDGTSAGASMAVVGEVPPFHVALPLRMAGADLMPMELRPQQSVDQLARITLDHRAGLDVPMLFNAEWTLTGPSAVPFRSAIGQGTPDQLDSFVQGFVNGQLGNSLLVDSKIDFDEKTNSATITANGIMGSPWVWERGVGSREFTLPTEGFEFRPDRSRSAWRDIPVALPGPYTEKTELTVLLPDSHEDYALEGKADFSTDLAHVHLAREAQLSGDRLTVVDSAVWPGGEIPPADISSQRQQAARFGSLELKLRAPSDVVRRYQPAARADRARFAPIEAAYARLIAKKPDELDYLRFRSSFRSLTWDWDGARADLDEIIDRDPGAADYLQRASLRSETGDLDGALEDAQAGWDLDPSLNAAYVLAGILPYVGRVEEAITLLEDQTVDSEDRSGLATTLSELEAQAGRKDEGMQRIEALLAQRPNDPQMLNARCWYQATWDYHVEQLADICTEAVEKADWSAPVLDSRAMGYYKLGRYQDALKDLDSALSNNPDLTPSLFMRGIVRLKLGDSGGSSDVREALARQPSIARQYARFGISAPSS